MNPDTSKSKFIDDYKIEKESKLQTLYNRFFKTDIMLLLVKWVFVIIKKMIMIEFSGQIFLFQKQDIFSFITLATIKRDIFFYNHCRDKVGMKINRDFQ